MATVETEPLPLTFEAQIKAKLDSLPISKIRCGLEIDNLHDMQAYTDALENGVAAVCNGYSDTMKHVSGHDVVADKVVARQRSAHGVSFGRLIGFKPSKGRHGCLTSVAYKSFSRAGGALWELLGYKKLQELGVETFDPIGIIPSEDGADFVVITKKRNDFMSLDRDDWIEGRQPIDERGVEIAERNTRTVSEIATTLAHLHSNGVFHPDGQIKNFAVTENGTVGVIDTENLQIRDLDDIDNPALAWEDLQKLVRSLILLHNPEDDDFCEDKVIGVGMLANMNLPQLRNACMELIFEPYLRTLEKRIDEGGDVDHLTGLAYHIQESFEKDPQWPLDLVVSF